MNINYFKEFAVLAETKNYWEAAERLFLNQSTLSKHIKAMENELNVPLFTRTTRKVELTEYGRALLPYAQLINRTQFEYSSLLLQIRNQHSGLVTVGSIPSMAQYSITDILLHFQEICPDCRAKIIEDDPKHLKQLLFEKKCDLAFLRETKTVSASDEDYSKLIRIPYLTDYLVAVLPYGHPLYARKELSLRELKDENFCFIKENSMMYDLCRSACQEADFIPNIVFDSHRLDSILDMVRKGNCIALLMNNHAEYACRMDASAGHPLAVVRILPATSTQISLCYLADTPLSAAAAQFLDYFQQVRTTYLL